MDLAAIILIAVGMAALVAALVVRALDRGVSTSTRGVGLAYFSAVCNAVGGCVLLVMYA